MVRLFDPFLERAIAMLPKPTSPLWLPTSPDRRLFLRGAGLGSAAALAWLFRPGRFAEELTATVPLTEGPFFPDRLPLDTDNDLLILNDSITPAVGEITHLTGRVLTRQGTPVVNALVEIWQVDSKGSYIHSKGRNPDGHDGNFQGYGRFLTDLQGQYYFRTIKPVPYTVGGGYRTPHIHMAVSRKGQRILTTQMLIKDDPGNEKDGLFRQIRDPELQKTLLAEFAPLPDSRIGELTARFDIVIGKTVEELEDGTLH